AARVREQLRRERQALRRQDREERERQAAVARRGTAGRLLRRAAAEQGRRGRKRRGAADERTARQASPADEFSITHLVTPSAVAERHRRRPRPERPPGLAEGPELGSRRHDNGKRTCGGA